MSETSIPDDVYLTAACWALKFPHPMKDERATGKVIEIIASAILEERGRVPDEIDIYRMLKAQKLRKRADIAKALAAALRWRPKPIQPLKGE